MTAVEWLIKEFDLISDSPIIKNVVNQAKELEKEQLRKVWKAAEQNMRSQFSSSTHKNVTFDEYFNNK